MNTADYWPMAREYSVWNTTVAALQFWTADLEVHVLSSTIEQVYNTFFCSTYMYLLCQQSDEILFSHFMTTLNTTFESKLVRTSTYPLHLDGPPIFTMFPVSRMHLLIQIQSHHTAQVPERHTADLYLDV